MSSHYTPEEEILKKAIYDKLSPRRRKYIDRVGYDNWDPFQKPKDPIDIRTDENKLTTQQLIRAFLLTVPAERYNDTYARGAFEICLGIVNEQDKHLGAYDFAKWYLQNLYGWKKPGEGD